MAFTCFSGSIPDLSTIIGMSFDGKRPPKTFLNCLFFSLEKSLKSRSSSCSGVRAGLRSMERVSSCPRNFFGIWLLALRISGPVTPKWVNPAAQLQELDPAAIAGQRVGPYGAEALVRREKIPAGFVMEHTSLEDIILFLARKGGEPG